MHIIFFVHTFHFLQLPHVATAQSLLMLPSEPSVSLALWDVWGVSLIYK
jgi:hypothetical protein